MNKFLNTTDFYNDFNIDIYLDRLSSSGIDTKYIIDLKNKILNGQIDSLNLLFINNTLDIVFVLNYGNIFINLPYLSKIDISDLSFDMLTKTNTKHFNILKKHLIFLNVAEQKALKLALKMYAVIGFEKSFDILNKKYGNFNISDIIFMFERINCSNVIFKDLGNKYEPDLNEKLINIIFGKSIKIDGTLIKLFFNNFDKLDNLKKKEIDIINEDMHLSFEEKDKQKALVISKYNKLQDNINYFFNNLNFIYNNWYLIEEEFLKIKNNSKLKLKLNMSQINEIVHFLTKFEDNDSYLFNQEQLQRINKIPNYEKRDYPLLLSDVFDYVGTETQYTLNPALAPQRAVELSRMMEDRITSKIPDVTINYNGYTLKVLNPQDRNIISGGYRSGCCFRPRGDADNYGHNNSLLTYCCTSSYGGAIEITNEFGKTIMFSPILRNGNVLLIYSFEGINNSLLDVSIANSMIYEWAMEIIKISKDHEDDEQIISVIMSDLNKQFNSYNSIGIIPQQYKFKVYDPEKKFRNMYYELNTKNQYIIAFDNSKTLSDIYYDYEVSKEYKYSNISNEIKYISVNEEQLKIINQIYLNKKHIAELERTKKRLLNNEMFEKINKIIFLINEIKKQNLLLFEKLFMLNSNSCLNIFNSYLYAISSINNISKTISSNIESSSLNFIFICYTEFMYLGVTIDRKIIGHCLNGYEDDFIKILNNLKKNISDNYKYEKKQL